jgi:hypothetical protein
MFGLGDGGSGTALGVAMSTFTLISSIMYLAALSLGIHCYNKNDYSGTSGSYNYIVFMIIVSIIGIFVGIGYGVLHFI